MYFIAFLSGGSGSWNATLPGTNAACVARAARSKRFSRRILRRPAHDFAHFDYQRRVAHAGSGRCLRSDLERARRGLDLHDPVTGEEFLGLGENAVRDRLAVVT